MGSWAKTVAAEGYVVFAPAWGDTNTEGMSLPQHVQLNAMERQAACAIAFARAHAAEYGGDPSTTILFGQSAGANTASVLAFNRPVPTEGCPGGKALGPISSLITYEGDWLLMDPGMWGEKAPTKELAEVTPWAGMSAHPELPVVVLVSYGSGGVVDPPVLDPPINWKTARDPVALRNRLATAGPDGGRIDVAQEQAVLYAALKAQGNPVSLTEVPGSDHMSVGPSGTPVLVAAFREAAGQP
jgi:acetyl esterase/lipase